MLLFLLLFLPSVTTTNRAKKDDITCNGLIFDHVYFDREVLVENLGRPYNLVLHKFSGTLFFSHTIQNGTEVDFEIMWCNLSKKICQKIKGVPGGYAIAYDPGNDDMYFGGHDGIYKYNFITKSAEFFAEEGKSIWGLFVRKNFYYIDYPSQKLYVYIDDRFVQVAEATKIEVDNFFVSKQSDVYFSNKTALYKVERVSKSTIVMNDEISIRQIVEDSYGDIYFCGYSGIYVEDKPYQRIKKVADIENAFGMTFDEHDRVIYSDKYAIYRLLPSSKSIACYDVQKSPPEIEEKVFKDYMINIFTTSEYCDLANKYLIAAIHVSADMDYIYFVVTLFVYSAKCLPNKTCNRIKIGNYWYEKELLWTDIGRPYNLNIHKGSNTLFFSYTVPEMYSDVDFQLAYYNLFSKEYQSIVGIRGGCAVAIDQSNDDIYLGGSDGIYKYNMVTKLADFYKQEGVNIWSLYHKKNLFYVSYPDQKLYIEIDGKFAKVKEFEQTEIDHIHISNEQAIYFANKTGLFKYNNIVSSIEIVNDLITVRQIVEDNNGDIYLCTNLGLFLDKKAKGFVNVLEMKNLHGLTFDRDNNFVLSDEKSVMKLVESRYGCMMSDEHW